MKKLLMLSVAIATITVAAVSMADMTSAEVAAYIEENLGLDPLRPEGMDRMGPALENHGIDPLRSAKAECDKHN